MTRTLPPPSCPLGYTSEDLDDLFPGERRGDFNQWMRGQTCSICDGQRYDHDLKLYEATACADAPHGPVTYTWDVQRYVDGR